MAFSKTRDVKNMEYVTGMYALNTPCPSLKTCGDWHWGALNWQKLHIKNTKDNIFGDYGLTPARPLPEHPDNKYPIANHIRACLDLMLECRFPCVQGMKDDFICNDEYNELIFEKVFLMHNLSIWYEINDFMWREYKLEWLRYVAVVKKKYFRQRQYCVVFKQRKKHYFHKYKLHIEEQYYYPLRF